MKKCLNVLLLHHKMMMIEDENSLTTENYKHDEQNGQL